ncbi:hypothetical protein QA645_36480 [Bradyrhizobium sp. CIAT3101]|uniref:hypothetical protein n=1 Tax=Bradyrhizobium sp. CIAT3101 TaxID=439387 RepID=UPI0024B27ABC|nr:hypothetical protein [Bradyrhizobium sp. CIAT3101]WFU79940.1 hypothetical protein QA645_36480 [Bradyrhizobium sp. CIAT3101]
MIYAINYDLKKPGRDYSGLYDAIKSCGAWWHYLGSTWLVDTNRSSAAIWELLKSHVDQNDSMLIIGVTSDYNGWLSQEAWDWINTRIKKAA